MFILLFEAHVDNVRFFFVVKFSRLSLRGDAGVNFQTS